MYKDKFLKEMLFTNEQIVAKCKELGAQIDELYKESKDLVLVGLLKGSVPFMAELIKHISVDHTQDFMIVSSYEGGTKSTGNLKIITDLATDIGGKDVLIVEDIVDTGRTLSKLIEKFSSRGASSIKTVTLLNKQGGRTLDYQPDIFGFDIENEFVYGFGLDVKEKLRNLPYIGIFNKDLIDEV